MLQKNRKGRPSIGERISAAWSIMTRGYIGDGTPTRRAGAVKKTPFAWPSMVNGLPQWSMYDFETFVEEGFNINSVIYSAIMYKVKSVSLAPLRAYTGDPDKPDLLPPAHELTKLTKRPNPGQSFRQMQGQAISCLNLAGNAYIFLDRPSRTSPPTAMYNMRPDRVRVIPKDGGIAGFAYTPQGKSPEDAIKIPPEYIAHVKFPNPNDPYEGFGEGLSPMSPLARSGDVDNRVTEFLDRLFKNGTMAFGILSFDAPIDPLNIQRMRTEWDEMYGGSENWGRPLVLDQGGKYERGIPSFQELGFDAIDQRNEARMLGPFGVPAILIGARLGLENATYSNAKELDKMFWQLTMAYELALFEDAFQYALADGNNFVMYDTSKVPALQKDLKELIAATAQLTSIGVPLNIASKKTGLDLEDIEGGDVGYLPMNLVPAMGDIPEDVRTPLTPPEPTPPALLPDGTQPPPDAPAPGQGDPGQVGDQRNQPGKRKFNRDAIIKRLEGRRQTPRTYGSYKGVAWTDNRAMRIWMAQDRACRAWEPEFRTAAKECFDFDRKNILAMVSEEKSRASAAKATVLWNLVKVSAIDFLKDASVEKWRQMFIPIITGVVEEASNTWGAELGLTFDVLNLLALKWFDDYTLKFAEGISETSRQGISDMLQQAEFEGWTVEQGSKRLGEMFDQWVTGTLSPAEFSWFNSRMPAFRLEMIVRTETIRSYNAGTLGLFKEWGIEQKQWWAAMDERTCDFCMELHGKIISTGSDFVKMGDTMVVEHEDEEGFSFSNSMNISYEDVGYPPLHPDCRCTILPVTDF